MSYGENYHDRGMVKWQGFQMPEQGEILAEQSFESKNQPVQKMQMDYDEIGHILSEARMYGKKVAVQIEEKDINNRYKPDVIGLVEGHDDLGIWIGNTKVGYDEIRHVELVNDLKWSDMRRF